MHVAKTERTGSSGQINIMLHTSFQGECITDKPPIPYEFGFSKEEGWKVTLKKKSV